VQENLKKLGLTQVEFGGGLPGLSLNQALGDQQGNQLDAIKSILGGNSGNFDVSKLLGSLNNSTVSQQGPDIGELLSKLGLSKTGLF
jgi:hypothetical protein